MKGTWVVFLVGEVRSPMLRGVAKQKRKLKKKKKEKIKNLDSKQNGKIFSPELKDPSFRTWRRENFLKQAMKTLTIKYKIDNLTTLSFRIFFPKENLRK